MTASELMGIIHELDERNGYVNVEVEVTVVTTPDRAMVSLKVGDYGVALSEGSDQIIALDAKTAETRVVTFTQTVEADRCQIVHVEDE